MPSPDDSSQNAFAAEIDTEKLGAAAESHVPDPHPIPNPDDHLSKAEQARIVSLDLTDFPQSID